MLHGFVPPVDVSTSAKLAASGNRIGDRCPYGLGGKRHLRVRHDRELAVVSEASADASTYSSRDDDASGPKPGGLISVAAELAAYSEHLASDVPIQDAP